MDVNIYRFQGVQNMIDKLIEKYETDSAEMLKVGAVEPAEEKQLIADLLKELKEYRNEKAGSMHSNIC